MNALEGKIVVALAIIVLTLLAITAWNIHERDKGAAQCNQDDLTAARKQLADQAQQIADYQRQLEDANDRHNQDQQILAAAAATPVPHLVCRAAPGPVTMPAVPAAAAGEPAAPGPTDQVHEPSFDPGPNVRRVSDAAEYYLEQCRDALNRWPSQPIPAR